MELLKAFGHQKRIFVQTAPFEVILGGFFWIGRNYPMPLLNNQGQIRIGNILAKGRVNKYIVNALIRDL